MTGWVMCCNERQAQHNRYKPHDWHEELLVSPTRVARAGRWLHCFVCLRPKPQASCPPPRLQAQNKAAASMPFLIVTTETTVRACPLPITGCGRRLL